jgi:hypothetical protein
MVRAPIRTPWTAEQDEKLLALIARGYSVLKAAAALDRGTQSVRKRALKLGVSFPTIRDARKKVAAAQPVRGKNDPTSVW